MIPQHNRRVTRWQRGDRALTPENLPVLKRKLIHLESNFEINQTVLKKTDDIPKALSKHMIKFKLEKPQRNFARGTSKSSKDQQLGQFLKGQDYQEWTFKADYISGEVGNLQSQKDFLQQTVKKSYNIPHQMQMSRRNNPQIRRIIVD